MRLAVGGIEHEANTYAKGLTTTSQFRVLRGDRLLAAAGQEAAVEDAVSACLQLDIFGTIVTADPPALRTRHIKILPGQSTTRRLWLIDPRATCPEESSA